VPAWQQTVDRNDDTHCMELYETTMSSTNQLTYLLTYLI